MKKHCPGRFLLYACIGLLLAGCSKDEPATGGNMSDLPPTVQELHGDYEAYAALAASAEDHVSLRILGAAALDIADTDGVKEAIEAAYSNRTHIMPYTRGLSLQSPYSWVHGHVFPSTQVGPNPVEDAHRAKVLAAITDGTATAGWTLDMEVVGEGPDHDTPATVTYQAFVLELADEAGSYVVLDPVVVGIPKLAPGAAGEDGLELSFSPAQHGTAGKSVSSSWKGCKEEKELELKQLNMTHWVSFLGLDCWDRGWCSDNATATVFCNTEEPSCPRQVSSTKASGDCTTRSGTGFGCEEGKDLYGVVPKADTIPGQGLSENGIDENCSIHTNIELMVLGDPVAWEVTYTTPKNPLGTASVKFSGTVPAHSIYQTHQALMCCQPEAPKDDPDTSDPDTGGSGDASHDTGGTGDIGPEPSDTGDTGDTGDKADAGDDKVSKCAGLSGDACIACCEGSSASGDEFQQCVEKYCSG